MPQITRTYPQPDSPAPQIGPRERAMAVYKYLLNIEPEQATEHPLFNVIEHAFVQQGRKDALAEYQRVSRGTLPMLLQRSLIEELKSTCATE